MNRTTISLEPSLLKTVKKLAQSEGATLGREISDLLAIGIQYKYKRNAAVPKAPFTVKPFAMGSAKIPLEDKEAIRTLLEKEGDSREFRR